MVNKLNERLHKEKERRLARIRFYAKAGYGATDLASILKVSVQRASQLLHEAGVKPRNSRPLLMRNENISVARQQWGINKA